MQTTEEIILIKKARAGDAQSLEAIVKKYMWLAVSKARKFYLVGGSYEDLLQEGLMGILKAVNDYDPDKNENPAAFISMCVKSKITDAVRKFHRLKHAPLNAATDIEDTTVTPREYVSDPIDDYIERESLDGFYANLNKILTKAQIEVLKFYLEGYSYAEIAALTKQTAKKIDNTLFSIKNKIKSGKKTFDDTL